MKELSKEWMYTQLPKNNYFLSVSKLEEKEYLKLYSYYYELCLNYFVKKMNLKNYDNQIKQLNLLSIPINKMDIYQYLSSSKLTYFYLHNNVYLERLASYEIQKIRNFIEENDTEFNLEKEKFVEETFNRCFLEGYNITNHRDVYYGPSSYQFLKPSNALIIGFRIEEKDKKAQKTKKELQNFIKIMEVEISQKVSVPVSLIYYTATSTIPVSRNYISEEEKKLLENLNNDEQKLKKYF